MFGGKWEFGIQIWKGKKNILYLLDDTILRMDIHSKKLSEFGKVLGFSQYTKIICVSIQAVNNLKWN